MLKKKKCLYALKTFCKSGVTTVVKACLCVTDRSANSSGHPKSGSTKDMNLFHSYAELKTDSIRKLAGEQSIIENLLREF